MTWVAKTVVNVVVRVVCEVVHDVVNFVIDVVGAVIGIIVDVLGILWNVITLDWDDVAKWWRELLSDLTDLGTAIFDGIKIIVRVATGGYIAEYVREKINLSRLRDYVRKKLEKAFGEDPKLLDSIKEKINLDFGPFGLEFRARSVRTFVDSRTGMRGQPPNLVTLHNAGTIDLYALSGIRPSAALDRPEVEASLIVGGGLDEDDIDDYLASQGEGPHFRIFALSTSAENEKLSVAGDKGRQIGIKLKWTRHTTEVTQAQDIDVDKDELSRFLQDVAGRDPAGSDVCTLAAAAVFTLGPVGGKRPFGWTTWFTSANPISGIIHRDRKPAAFFKYVLIHECGHYFSLEHPGHDGLDKIMYSPRENSWWSWNLILEFLWWSGEPRFTLDDGKRTWDFLIDRVPQCLMS